MEFRLLGSLEVLDDGRPVELQGLKQRALLAVLLLHANELVSRDLLIDQLWGERPPATAAHSLDVYVSRLRKALRGANGTEDVLVTRAGGYLLRLEPDDLDAARFERLVDEGRRALDVGDAAAAAVPLREALELWRGHPLAELAYEPFVRDEVERLEELRLVALEGRLEADLALGRHDAVVGELEVLVAKHPLRERPRRLLMLALYRSGRQADALAVYTDARRLLVDELGIEPSRELQTLQQAILRQDPALDPPPREVETAASSEARPATRRRALVAVTAGAATIAAAVLAFVLLSGGDSRALAGVDANAIGLISSNGKIESEVRGDMRPTGVAAGGGSIWIADFNDHVISRIDPRTSAVRDSIPVGAGPSGIAVGNHDVWVANDLDGTISRIDARTDRIVQWIPVGNGPGDLAFGASAVWVANANDETISRIDARNGHVTTFPAGGDASAVAFGFGSLWVANGLQGTVTRFDPRSREIIAVVGVGNGPTSLAAGDGGVWVANGRDDTVSRIDPRRNVVVATAGVGEGPADVGVGAGGVWVANELDGSISLLDAKTGRVRKTVEVGGRVPALAATPAGLWVAVAPGGSAHRGGTLSIALPLGVDLDSATAYDVFSWQLAATTGDGLIAFRHVGGSAGAGLVPDLAEALPEATAGGTSYRFRLRPRLRYSTGAFVKASDFRRALERVFTLRSPGSGLYAGLVGAAACTSQPSHCDLSGGVVADDSARTVTFRLVEPDPELLYKLALPFAFPVPRGTPRARAQQPIAGTGPYFVAAAGKRQLKLVRNPYFHEWSRAAHPDGYVDAIVIRLGERAEKEIRAVEADRLDWEGLGNASTRLLPALRVRHSGQTHANPSPVTNFVVLNTRVRPFDDIRVRRALAYAVDPNVWVKLAGGSAAASPTCQILPRGFPGYRHFCLYRGPDLAHARRLVAASGTAGMRVVVWTFVPGFARQGRYIVDLLQRLGYRASLRAPSSATYWSTISDSRNRVQIAFDTWIADYPAPSNFINVLLSCGAFRPATALNLNLAEFCDRRIDAAIQRARRLQATNPEAANRFWARIDRNIMRQVPWVPMTNPKAIDFVSRRVGNFEYNPQWGMLIDQLWVR